jgi:hypothetical protein
LKALWLLVHVVHHQGNSSLKAWSSQVNYCPFLNRQRFFGLLK